MAPQRRIDVVLDSVRRLLRMGATANLLNLLQKQHPADLGQIFGELLENERQAAFTVLCAIGLQGIRLVNPTLGECVVVTGLALPVEMLAYNENGCAPEFALWSFVDLGYLTYYVSYLLATDAIEGVEGETFVAGRMGEYTITKDPTRDVGLRVLMGPFTVYTADNVEAAAQ